MELNKFFFKKPTNELEGTAIRYRKEPQQESSLSCPSCKKSVSKTELVETKKVCPHCRYHFKMTARQRLSLLADKKSFTEHDKGMTAKNLIDFPEYDEKIKKASETSREKEAVITGVCSVGDYKCAVFVMEPSYIMGSMGSVVGEKITRLFEYATEKQLPVLGVAVSGGARMQEGIISLIQMAKISGAVKYHNDSGNLFISLLTDPTLGGVTASFAMQGDIIIAEPGALVGFAGPRVIEQTIRQKLPDNFQKSEHLLKTGFIDDIVERGELKEYIIKILRIHAKKSK